MENVDVVKILGYGVTGLSFLLAFMAYSLLVKEQKKQEPNEAFLKSISKFMKFCFLLALLGLTSEVILTVKDKVTKDNDGTEQYFLTYNLKVSDTEIERDNSVYYEDLKSLLEISKSDYSRICIVANSKNIHINTNVKISWELFDSVDNKLNSGSFASTLQNTDSNFWICKPYFTSYPVGQYRFSLDIAGNKNEIRYKLID